MKIATALLGVFLVMLPVQADARAKHWNESRCHPRVGCSVSQFRTCHAPDKHAKKVHCTKWRTPRYAR